MFDPIRKTLFAGLGATVVTVEKMNAALQELVDKGKLSADEARSTAEKIAEESKAEYEEVRSSLNKTFREWLEKTPVCTREEIKALETRVARLESFHAESDSSEES